MLKLIGASFILFATTWTGFVSARYLRERPKQLQALRTSLETLEAEIMFSHTPLGDAAQKIADQYSKPISQLYFQFAEKLKKDDATVRHAWSEALLEIWPETSLKQTEFAILDQFGTNLGRHDRETQQKQIMVTKIHLEREEELAREIQIKYEKMIKNAGLLTGLLFILLLF